MKEKPTCTENALLHSKGLNLQVVGEDGEQAVDGVVLLFIAHVGAANSGFPQTQIAVCANKHNTWKEIHSCKDNILVSGVCG